MHLLYEFLSISAYFHSFPDVVHKSKFPALSLSGGTVFSAGHLASASLIGGKNRELMLHADLIAELPKLTQGGRCLPQLHPSFTADRIDHKVGMHVPGIAMGTYLHLMPRPSFGGKFQPDRMCLLIGDVFFGRKGLNILVKIDAVQLVVSGLGGEKFRKRIYSVAVHPSHIPVTSLQVNGLVLPLAVVHHRPHGADMLFCFLDVGHSCQRLPPMWISSSYSRACKSITSWKL